MKPHRLNFAPLKAGAIKVGSDNAALAASALLFLLLATLFYQRATDPIIAEPVSVVPPREHIASDSAREQEQGIEEPTTIILPAPPPAALAIEAIPKPTIEPDTMPDPSLATAVSAPPPEQPSALRPSPADIRTGRALLQLLEAGKGPVITIDWPEGAITRDKLARKLERCYGMEIALLDQEGQLYRANSSGQEEFNLDRWSGFLRVSSGKVSQFEQAREDDLRQQHGRHNSLQTVRLFPRQIDAALLAGLANHLGSEYQGAQEIRLAYELTDSHQVIVRLIEADEQARKGLLVLPSKRQCN